MAIHDMKLTITTDGAGAATVTGEDSVVGFLYLVVWVDGTLADGVDAVLSQSSMPEGVDETILTLTNANEDKSFYALTSETEAVWVTKNFTYPLLRGVPKLVVSSGGATVAGACHLYWFD